ncbi:Chromate resistance protein ChrB [Bosea sp. 62]|uniref:Chromate resistance protein ChrB n=1 Tax=unclassified Bosea (in: a-proteobacteria) TaxID=2653178 RepID=UPI001255467F|nr:MULTISPECIES: Chromate resistance protein ChrB [unclassified Bosea (in: a-proteobacteria)]CAD5270789.1 Chromate resistance protein ChrB [Bosea sp. 46]CAD5274467.1 Chromate resistance protein ChrB [Bosea sp. 7B]CAD5290300.1 Chromate resistance protein ChrB [Bosea sp. 21B]VVT60701.1 Chromate resistance protein ChrB [Bosea sp. EC-HK365B]VXB54065.1 Chromate resistance protein ChrB [Bosea sp. 127]
MVSLEWLLLTYKVPTEPARKRVSIWRKLKGMGAVYLQGGVCVLPKTDDHLRRLKMLENEIAEAEGEALLLATIGLDQKQQDKIISRFNADRDDEYKEFIEKCIAFETEIAHETEIKHFTYAELGENEQELAKFKNWMARIQKLDFYGAPLSKEAIARLVRSEAILDVYAHNVFAAQAENRLPREAG